MTTTQDVQCPKCGQSCWDNRLTKRNPKQPDFKCKDKSCDGVIWPPRNGQPARGGTSVSAEKAAYSSGGHIPAIDGPKQETAVPHEKMDLICAASTTFLRHVLKTEVPELQKAEIGASDTYIHARVANLLITAEKAGLFR